MPTFKDLWIWKKSHQLMAEIHSFSKTLPKQEHYRLRDQIERSSVSVAANIAEGYMSYYYKDKLKAFFVSRKEAAETQNHIETLLSRQYLTKESAEQWFNQYQKIIKGINGFINYIKRKHDTAIKR